jgi:hypothetical protein
VTGTLLVVAFLGSFQEEPSDLFGWARRLDDLDLSAAWGDLEVEASGELDFEYFAFGGEAPGISVEEAPLRTEHYKFRREAESPEAGGRLQLFLDAFYQDWLGAFVEFRADHGSPAEEDQALDARLEQYWARFMVPGQPALNFQAGKFAAPVGNFIPRHAPRTNPLTTFPLAYDHVTSFMYMVDATDTVLSRRDVEDVKFWRVPIWQAVYGTGAMAFGAVGDLSYAVAAMNAAPGTWPWDWTLRNDDFDRPSVYLHAGYAPDIGTKLGASWARGPYDRHDAVGIPPGRETWDFPQTLAGLDFEYSRGDFDLFAELIWTRFEAPLIDDMDLWTYSVEGKYTFLPGLFGAVRFAQIFFGEIEGSDGERHEWDRDLARVELGGGYFFTRNLFLKATVQLNSTHGGREPDDNMLMVQLGLGF